MDILTLWTNGQLPIKDAIYFSDGTVFNLSIISYPSPKIIRHSPFILHINNINMEYITSIGETFRLNLFEKGVLVLGEGSYGSEGFFAHLNSKDDLLWVLYSEKCNPFISAVDSGTGRVIIESSAEYLVSIDVEKPQDILVIDNS